MAHQFSAKKQQLYFEQIHTLIKTHGHAIQAASSEVPWAYTIGLWPKHGYEIIVFLLDVHIATAILNSIAHTLNTGRSIPLDTKMPDERGSLNNWVANMPVLFKQCLPERLLAPDLYVNIATQYHGQGVPFRQLVLCDKNKRFPGEPGFADGVPGMLLQPLLYKSPQ